MEIRKGIAVSPGMAMAEAIVLDAEDYRIPTRYVEENFVEREKELLERAVEHSIAELKLQRDKLASNYGGETSGILDFHVGILQDHKLRRELHDLILRKKCSAAYAVSRSFLALKRRFSNLKNTLFAQRVKDIQDIEKRLLQHLLGEEREDLEHLTKDVVLVAHDLPPSLCAGLDKTRVVGVVTDVGGLTSHTAILLRSLGMPAVIGLSDFTSHVSGGELVVVDGRRSLVIANPDLETIRRYESEIQRIHQFTDELVELKELPAETLDGLQVQLMGNIEFPYESEICLRQGASGIGLFRTEYLYIRAQTEPNEEEQYEAYTTTIKGMQGRTVTIRTMDLGADKYTQAKAFEPERNPFLGLRSIRYCLRNLDFFKRQLRAILRASVHGEIRIMFPLIINLMEFRQAKMALFDAMEDLEEMGLPFRKDIPIGIMVETPAAAIMCKEFVREVDFVSIGTNDLIQYTLAVDRSNERVAPLYTAAHPAVLRLLRDIIITAEKAGVDCSLCGEIAGEPVYTLLLLGLGLRQFSMASGDIPEIKKLIRSSRLTHARKVAREALKLETDRQVHNYLRDETRKLLPPEVI
ncbi:MAG: Phosphoenolpyruvate-protein phosphotransferase [Phycisphaerae bacterium]|nr:Phosphoenolpyruvate-protein phosphotransferase [Phycisphaerae bacterium]